MGDLPKSGARLAFDEIPLCGREQELDQLTDLFDQIHTTNHKRVLLLEGASGCGKTKLLNAFRTKVEEQGGLFLLGKFDNAGDAMADPFEALRGSLEDFVSQTLTKDEQLLRRWKDSTTNQEIYLLSTLCPSILKVLDEHADMLSENRNSLQAGIGEKWVFQRLCIAVRDFLGFICQEYLVVLVQENVDHADSDYWSVLEAVLLDSSSSRLLLIVSSSSPASKIPINQNNNKTHRFYESISTMTLKDLSVDSVAQVLSCLTQHNVDACQDLAQLLHSKTGGNAESVVELLKRLEFERLIFFSSTSLCWEWDLDTIRSATSLDDKFDAKMNQQLLSVDDDLKMSLAYAAHLGSKYFDIRVLHRLQKYISRKEECFLVDDLEKLQRRLQFAVGYGVLEKLSEHRLKFSHERIRERAKEVITPDGPFMFPLQIGLVNVVNTLDEDDLVEEEIRHDVLLNTTNFLNSSHSKNCIALDLNLLILVDFNYLVAIAAFRIMALHASKLYLEKALELVRELGGWQRHDSLLLKISTFYARVLYSQGHSDKCCAICDEIAKMTGSFADAVSAYLFKMYSLFQLGRYHQALDFSSKILRGIGFSFPRTAAATKLAILGKLVRFYFRPLDLAKLGNLPAIEDQNILSAMEIYWVICEMSVLNGDLESQVLANLSMVKITMEHGYCSHTPGALIGFSVLQRTLGRHQKSDQSEEVALKMVQNVDPVVQFVSCFFCDHWKYSFANTLNTMMETKRASFQTSNISLLFFSVHGYSLIYLQTGLSLEPLSRDAHKMHGVLADLSLHHFVDLFEIPAQFISNLMGCSKNGPVELSGDFMSDQETSLQSYKLKKNDRAVGLVHLFRMFLGYIFNDIDIALSMSRKLYHAVVEGPSPLLAFRFFVQGLTAFGWARKTKLLRSLSFLREGQHYYRRLCKMAAKGVANVSHLAMLLRAEDLAIRWGKKSPDIAQRTFDQAIAASARLGYTHVQAIGNELAGIFFHGHGDSNWSQTYLSRAHDLYQSWGAKAKTQQLVERYPNYLAHVVGIDSSSLSRETSVVNAIERFSDVSLSCETQLSSSENIRKLSSTLTLPLPSTVE